MVESCLFIKHLKLITDGIHMFKLTEEQSSVINSKEAHLKANAFAGTGKTSTLVEYAKARPTESILYVAFNKSVQNSAVSKFPNNVICKTGHALAYRYTGAPYRSKMAPNIKPKLVAPILNINFKAANHAVKTLQNYLYSVDSEISLKHVDEIIVKKGNNAAHVLSNAIKIWELMCDYHSNKIPMVHDGYLKLFHLSKPNLSEFNTILFDEAQDANPVMADIVLNQMSNIVLMGDKHQAIYGWRGATNIMDTITDYSEMYLSQSFRFGQPIADVANIILKIKDETILLKGTEEIHSVLKEVDTHYQYAVLARTNALLFDHAVESLKENIPLFFIGGFNSIRILSAHNLKFGGYVADPEVRSFKSFIEMYDYSLEVYDLELKALCNLIDKYGKRIPELIDQVSSKIVDQKDARIILSTVHKAKGLEFGQVVLKDDFGNPESKNIDPEEINLLYVAATRAVYLLEINDTLKELLEKNNVVI